MADFKRVLRAEAREILRLRRRRGQNPADTRRLGLALSGGGIRSATFNLGVLQALAEFGLLGQVDYLSTVSGGGYIGSWLIGWIKREGLDHVGRELASAPPPEHASRAGAYKEPRPINFLREYSNYLTPRLGFLGADTWSDIAMYLRNLLLNLTVLVCFLSSVLLLPRLAQIGFAAWGTLAPAWLNATILATFLLLLVAWAFVTANIADFSLRECADGDGPSPLPPRFTTQPWVLTCVVLPVSLSAFTGTWALWNEIAVQSLPMLPLRWALWGAAGYTLLRATGLGLGRWLASTWFWGPYTENVGKMEAEAGKTLLISAPAAGALGGYLLYWIARLFCHWTHLSGASTIGLTHVTVFGPALLIAALLLTVVLHIGLMGICFSNQRREWWARVGGWLLIVCVVWLGLASLSVYGPLAAILLSGMVVAKISSIVAWLGSTIFGVITGSGKKLSGSDPKEGVTLNRAATLAPYVFIVGLLLVLSWGISVVVPPARSAWTATCPANATPAPCAAPSANAPAVMQLPESAQSAAPSGTEAPAEAAASPGCSVALALHAGDTANATATFTAQQAAPEKKPANSSAPYLAYWTRWQFGDCFHGMPLLFLHLLYWLGGFAAVALLLAWRVDINEFSMHLLYRNRLVRCYLGASNESRDAQCFTGFDPDDDELLADFSTYLDKDYAGPYPIVNAALNVTSREQLAWQERKAESFIFTPRYSGFQFREEQPIEEGNWATRSRRATGRVARTLNGGYRRTREYAYQGNEDTPGRIGGVYLGTALSISGAAASPNMGYHTSAPLAFLMTVFNVRLGWWLGNPRSPREAWKRATPLFSLGYLLSELAAATDDRSRYVYLSDGGHFENLGLYELVRRRCAFIIASDADADPELHFGDLGNAIRKCRSDFGVEIDLPLDGLTVKKDSPYSEKHFALGTIRYPDGGEPGKLLYIKACLNGHEPRDVLAYQQEHVCFPHEATVDQWFDESQFESYRALGRYAVRSTFAAIDGAARMPVAELFTALTRS